MRDFAAIDYEPTSICSVGIAVVRGGEIVERVHRLIRPEPEYYVRRFSEEIHGIFRHDTESKPVFPYVWRDIEPLLDGLPLVAHNKGFDENVLKHTMRAYSMDYPDYQFYCTLTAARRTFPKHLIGNYKLPTVCAYMGIDFTRHHHALADAEGCARIAMEIL